MRLRFIRLAAIAALSLAVSACQDGAGGEGAAGGGAEGGGAPPPSQVGVIETKTEALPVISELPGRIAPTRIAEVRPRVGGIVVRRVFEQGTFVEEGQPLFELDKATYEVEVQAQQASVASAQAQQLQAQQDYDRISQLARNRTASQAQLDTAEAALAQARAGVLSAQAAQRAAEINLDYATVRAPISGRIGRAQTTEGALVSETSAEPLATIQQLDPVYADIQQPVSQLLRLRTALESGRLRQIAPDVAQVRLKMDDGADYPEPGKLLFAEATVDETSGQVTLRAEFPNPNGDLLPGMYVRVAIEQGIEENAIAVPNQAVQRDTAGRSQLYIVDAENKVVVRNVTVARVLGTRSVISEGLKPGEKVIADGFQKTGPGATVVPEPWVNPLTQPPAAPAADTPAPAPAPAPAAEANAAPAPSADAGQAGAAETTPTPTPAPGRDVAQSEQPARPVSGGSAQ
ncbi:efflux RND transporter periplasmic adaptor subunit [Antarcticirhabdus aurantiaca]|uniref:Efflux RND transporter periplasmic adaptor subunit n=1 Tax=Antarcticirhabdus aurantiaca TaxID=2606717 RepID=A0ACD4NK19_9HYPH|nr:efflux RND transporter periplasmic adaptor subunit [Antarcticirhabdus aurantiaca]WAJ27109.1 efflux RND transporter periplasmic adaptor subunit [Jeongeuplla avenae]